MERQMNSSVIMCSTMASREEVGSSMSSITRDRIDFNCLCPALLAAKLRCAESRSPPLPPCPRTPATPAASDDRIAEARRFEAVAEGEFGDTDSSLPSRELTSVRLPNFDVARANRERDPSLRSGAESAIVAARNAVCRPARDQGSVWRGQGSI